MIDIREFVEILDAAAAVSNRFGFFYEILGEAGPTSDTREADRERSFVSEWNALMDR